MVKDGFFLAKSSNAVVLQIPDENLLEHMESHHEDHHTQLLHQLDTFGGHVVGEIAIPEEIESEEEEQE